jgi:energy-coupling factor transporter ATP-binding protein EcfA2
MGHGRHTVRAEGLGKRFGGTRALEGFDVAREPARVRRNVGFTGQQPVVDEILTGRENLVSSRAAARRADELLEQFELTDAAHRQAKHYSGDAAPTRHRRQPGARPARVRPRRAEDRPRPPRMSRWP